MVHQSLATGVACNPDFCLSRAHGAYFCDPADSASYYRCVFGEAHHFTCGPGTVYDGSVCNLPHTACITNPVPDSSPGEVVNGVCVATTGPAITSTGTTGSAFSETTGSTVSETTGSTVSETSGTTAATNTEPGGHGVIWQQYRRHLQMKSECAVVIEVLVATPMSCASECTISGSCTGFNLYTDPHNTTPSLQYMFHRGQLSMGQPGQLGSQCLPMDVDNAALSAWSVIGCGHSIDTKNQEKCKAN
ncbi:uncharacterized protein [Haliotis asinina]|uniref:uncharacterized protein n=1 Tax=Haliotis asinina TaxID=109174 RepID=UPI00353227B5